MTTARRWTPAELAALHERAATAAQVAAREMLAREKPSTIVATDITGRRIGAESWTMPHGPCGFGWVTHKGNTAFGRWAKKAGISRPEHPSGRVVSMSRIAGTQSLAANEAAAKAYAAVLVDAGFVAYAGSRID